MRALGVQCLLKFALTLSRCGMKQVQASGRLRTLPRAESKGTARTAAIAAPRLHVSESSLGRPLMPNVPCAGARAEPIASSVELSEISYGPSETAQTAAETSVAASPTEIFESFAHRNEVWELQRRQRCQALQRKSPYVVYTMSPPSSSGRRCHWII